MGISSPRSWRCRKTGSTPPKPKPTWTAAKFRLTGERVYGSSSINSMIYIRGNRRDYDHWNFLGNEGWGYEDVLPFFKLPEDYEGKRSQYHGSGGPLSVTNNLHATPAAESRVAFRILAHDLIAQM